MWLRDDVSRDDLADSLAGGSAGVDCTSYRGNVPTHDRSYQTSIDLLPTYETDIRGFDHRVSSFNHRHQATTFDHSECFRHQLPPVGRIVTKTGHNKAQKAQHIQPMSLCFLPFAARSSGALWLSFVTSVSAPVFCRPGE